MQNAFWSIRNLSRIVADGCLWSDAEIISRGGPKAAVGSQLGQMNRDRIANGDFRDPAVKDAKQAEFLVYRSFPWTLVRKIGVISEKIAERVREIVSVSDHLPDVQVQPGWYY